MTVDGKLITKVAAGDVADVEAAVQAARAAYKSSWGLKVPGSQRGLLLYKLAELIEAHADEISALEALNAGTYHCFEFIPDLFESLRQENDSKM